jgi:hypothetical protein
MIAFRNDQNPSVSGIARLLFRKPELVRKAKKRFLHGTAIAVYIAGQERRLVDPPSQVVAGVRTVTTNMDGRDALPRMSRPFAFKASRKKARKAHKKAVLESGPDAPVGNLSKSASA